MSKAIKGGFAIPWGADSGVRLLKVRSTLNRFASGASVLRVPRSSLLFPAFETSVFYAGVTREEGAIAQLELAQAVVGPEVARSLRSLLQVASDDGEPTPSAESIEGLAAFLRQFPVAKAPSLGVTPTGELYARWRQTTETVFSLRFLDAEQVAFVRLYPRWSGGSRTQSGICKISAIRDCVPFEEMRWLEAGTSASIRVSTALDEVAVDTPVFEAIAQL